MGASSEVLVLTELNVDSRTYHVKVQFTPTLSRVMGRLEAVEYAAAVYAAAAAADYDAAVMRQLTVTLGMDDVDAAQIVKDIRDVRVSLPQSHTNPARLIPGVALMGGKPFVHVHACDEKWEWTPTEARHHASGVLTAAANIGYDTDYLNELTEQVGTTIETASQAVAGLADHHPTEGDPS